MAKQQDKPQQSKAGDQQNDNAFPGYPHYPKTEDIMDGRSKAERVNVDVENLPNFRNTTNPHHLNQAVGNEQRSATNPTDDSELGIQMGTEADVTPEERKMLEDDMYYPTRDEDNLRQARLDNTDFDGEPLNEESFGAGQTETGEGLDLESKTGEVAGENTGEGDEENQYFSLGGDGKDDAVEGSPQ